MSREERILDFMRREGPLLPNKLAKFLGTNLIIAGAHLAELSSRKKVLISHLKVGGGSPLYYLSGQEEKLQNFDEDLNEKDKRSFVILKEKKILRDRDLDPLTRVSLRNIKDFAKPLEVNLNGAKEIFWRWYLVKNEEVSGLIKGLLEPKAEIKKEEPIKEEPKPVPEVKEIPKVKVEKEEKKELPREEKKIEEPKPEIKEDKQEVLERTEVKPNPKKELKSDFYEKIKNYLDLKNIKIRESQALRKTEINLMISVPSGIGEILYYCKAKAKKKCNDKDVSSAFLEGQIKKLPVLFLYNGEMTKKAEEMVKQDIFKNLILLQMD